MPNYITDTKNPIVKCMTRTDPRSQFGKLIGSERRMTNFALRAGLKKGSSAFVRGNERRTDVVSHSVFVVTRQREVQGSA